MKYLTYIRLTMIATFSMWAAACGQDECVENIDCPEQWQCIEGQDGMRCVDPEEVAEEAFQNSDIADTSAVDQEEFYANHSETISALRFADDSNTPRPNNVNRNDYIGIRGGDRGWEVYEFQEFLNAAGANIVSDGVWGAKSTRALKAFQRAHGISATGKATSRTVKSVLKYAWKAKNEVRQSVYTRWVGIRKGSAGSAVKTLQRRLRALGFPVRRISGKMSTNYGLKALKGFQIRVGITADGVVGARTIKKLISGRAFRDLLEFPSERASTSISYRQFRKIPNLAISKARSRVILPYVNLMLKNAGAKTRVEKAMLVSQIAHETGYFASMTERRSRHRSSRSTYKGRGFIQLTGRWNYKTAGIDLNLPILKHPSMVSVLMYGAMTTSWYWRYTNMKKFVRRENIRGCIKKINPGGSTNKRARYYRKVKRALW